MKRTIAAFLLASASCAMAAPVVFVTSLSGAQEIPPNASPATGWARVTFDDIVNTMRVEVQFSGLESNVTAAHIHCCFAGAAPGSFVVATPTPSFPGFPSGATSGAYDQTFDLTLTSSYRAGFVTAAGGTAAGAKSALYGALNAGTAYLNIHTVNRPGGEILGFLNRVPEPASYALAALALFGLGVSRRGGSGASRRSS